MDTIGEDTCLRVGKMEGVACDNTDACYMDFLIRQGSMGRTTRDGRMDYDCALLSSFGFLMTMEWNIYAHGHLRIQNMIPEELYQSTRSSLDRGSSSTEYTSAACEALSNQIHP
jgi:hypothetical protein